MDGQLINSLFEQLTTFGGAEAHAKLEFKDKQKTAVISAYYGVRASHIVLDELYEWAEENEKKEIVEKIEELTRLED